MNAHPNHPPPPGPPGPPTHEHDDGTRCMWVRRRDIDAWRQVDRTGWDLGPCPGFETETYCDGCGVEIPTGRCATTPKTARDDLARKWHDMSDHAADGTPFGGPLCNCYTLAPRIERLMATRFGPWVQGRCPTCASSSLFVGSGGYLTCGDLSCSRPESPSEALGVEFPDQHIAAARAAVTAARTHPHHTNQAGEPR